MSKFLEWYKNQPQDFQDSMYNEIKNNRAEILYRNVANEIMGFSGAVLEQGEDAVEEKRKRATEKYNKFFDEIIDYRESLD